jgi:hypothetical protein
MGHCHLSMAQLFLILAFYSLVGSLCKKDYLKLQNQIPSTQRMHFLPVSKAFWILICLLWMKRHSIIYHCDHQYGFFSGQI